MTVERIRPFDGWLGSSSSLAWTRFYSPGLAAACSVFFSKEGEGEKRDFKIQNPKQTDKHHWFHLDSRTRMQVWSQLWPFYHFVCFLCQQLPATVQRRSWITVENSFMLQCGINCRLACCAAPQTLCWSIWKKKCTHLLPSTRPKVSDKGDTR